MSINWKMVVQIPVDWNTQETIEARMAFISKLGNSFLRSIFYVDETGFNLHSKRRHGRALSGEPAKLTLVRKEKRLTVIAAIGLEGFIHYRLVDSYEKKRGTTAEDFRSFLLDLVPKLQHNSVIVLDNARIHHAESLNATKEMIKARKS
jgi:hypothetical protein